MYLAQRGIVPRNQYLVPAGGGGGLSGGRMVNAYLLPVLKIHLPDLRSRMEGKDNVSTREGKRPKKALDRRMHARTHAPGKHHLRHDLVAQPLALAPFHTKHGRAQPAEVLLVDLSALSE